MASEARRPPAEVVALLASAGGLEALTIVLCDLPADFPAAVVVQQHLGGNTSVLPSILAHRSGRRVDWAADGQQLKPGQVIVCPAGMHTELLPDGSCRVTQVQGRLERRCDVLMASMASSYGRSSVAVVLSGSGRDGADGVVSMTRAGGWVIAQRPDTAEYPSMPTAAARAGAHAVLPIEEIGGALISLTGGMPVPWRQREVEAAHALFDGPGEVRELLRQTDWAVTPLGPLTGWPAALRTLVRATSRAGHSMAAWWDRDELHLIETSEQTPEWNVAAMQQTRLQAAKTVGVLFFRLEGALIAVNDAFAQLSGYPRADLTGTACAVDLTGEEFRHATSELLRRMSEVDAAVSNTNATVATTTSQSWALCSPIVTDGGGSTADVRLEAQFNALVHAVDENAHSGEADGVVGDPTSWLEFTGQLVDEWIGWGWVSAEHSGGFEPAGSLRSCVASPARRLGRVTAFPLREHRRADHLRTLEKLVRATTAGETPMDSGQVTTIRQASSNAITAQLYNDAAARAEAARLRVIELRRRRQELAAGGGATAQTVAMAQRHAAEAQCRALQARQAATKYSAALSRLDEL